MQIGEGFLKERYVPMQAFREEQGKSIENIEEFWAEQAKVLDWFKTWEKVLDDSNAPFFRWFVGGELNASYNALDRHIKEGKRNRAAIIWESERGETRTLTYYELYREVNRFASALKNLGVEKGDRVVIYMPLVPEVVIAMLASVRIGAIHSVVFSGFSAEALATRINDAKAKVVITADYLYRRGKALNLKEIVDKALLETPSVEDVVVLRREENGVNMVEGRNYDWDELLEGAEKYVEPVPVESNHPLFILYTSGTTGKPKGIIHSTGGYLVYVAKTMEWAWGITESDLFWNTADVGWITGHSYLVYGPLTLGLTVMMYEGALNYPRPDRPWELIEKHGVTIFYTAPTAIRMLMRYGDEWVKKHDLSSLRLLGSVGEPINPRAWKWYYEVVGGGRCPIIDTWWQTETGGYMIYPSAGIQLPPLKPGSATFPGLGVDADVFKADGTPAKPNERGYLVIKKPWPGMLLGIWGDDERYIRTYWQRFSKPDEGVWIYYPADYAMKDDEGYFWIFGRADEVLNVSGHRIGTAEIEHALVLHPAVAEAAVIGRPDEIKGEVPVAFVILKENCTPREKLKKELIDYVRGTLGPIAAPAEVFFVNKLPKTRSGKIMRRVLKALASGKSLGDLSTLEDEASVEEVKKALEGFEMR
ncbi:acetate--CoA ligase [Thermococcus sp.]|uniref:acetate--CoA ligase n=1 Tax=Thermococcus sp. TaxID=35749 RepID=UPI00262362A7|nr:acetate--CoA ligase [Thermococcus sp.]